MTSPPSSHSEGEILSSDSEKATHTLPSYNDTSVDRPPRNHAIAVRDSRPRSRSRSPYRAPRGEKRPRYGAEIERHTRAPSRSQHARHNFENRSGYRPGRRPQEIDTRPRKRINYGHDHSPHRPYSSARFSSRSRSRSRSPFRHSRLDFRSNGRNTSKHDEVEAGYGSAGASYEMQLSREESSVSRNKTSDNISKLESNAKTLDPKDLQIRPNGILQHVGPRYVLVRPVRG